MNFSELSKLQPETQALIMALVKRYDIPLSNVIFHRDFGKDENSEEFKQASYNRPIKPRSSRGIRVQEQRKALGLNTWGLGKDYTFLGTYCRGWKPKRKEYLKWARIEQEKARRELI